MPKQLRIYTTDAGARASLGRVWHPDVSINPRRPYVIAATTVTDYHPLVAEAYPHPLDEPDLWYLQRYENTDTDGLVLDFRFVVADASTFTSWKHYAAKQGWNEGELERLQCDTEARFSCCLSEAFFSEVGAKIVTLERFSFTESCWLTFLNDEEFSEFVDGV